MPSVRKKLMFLAGFSASLGTCILIAAIMATDNWITSSVHCMANSTGNATGELQLRYGLFEGVREKLGCPLLIDDGDVKVMELFGDTNSAKHIHIVVILFTVLGLVFSFLSTIVTFYNSLSNPYETICGPLSVYACSSVSCIVMFLAMILFVINTKVNDLSTILVRNSVPQTTIELKHKSDSYGYSFWLILLSLALNITSIVIVYTYQHANYTKQKEQQRPTEYAPKDVLMY
ncbi:clarin-3 [Callorhinchus milii]|uniref:Clarin 3 n=1 Tax=Callorhinchus milii TaxID=7868 RepID=V9LAC4_CALMI|nr:clarin-3 [Callorhinchus milii]|eukprot:gi/632936273/ref/XP_007894255.1/ PREDICTED: clarin-3 [Callorhinchus milii]